MGRLRQKLVRAGKRVGVLTDVDFSIYRPVYSSANHMPGSPIATRPMRIDVGGQKLMEPAIPGVFAYDVFVDINATQIGDILIPTVPGNPPVTVVSIGTGNFKANTGIMCDHLCRIDASLGDTKVTNVRFSWAGPAFPGSGLNDALEESVKIGRRKAVMFKIQGVGLARPIVKGDRLVELDNDIFESGISYVWTITDITTYNQISLLTLVEGQ